MNVEVRLLASGPISAVRAARPDVVTTHAAVLPSLADPTPVFHVIHGLRHALDCLARADGYSASLPSRRLRSAIQVTTKASRIAPPYTSASTGCVKSTS